MNLSLQAKAILSAIGAVLTFGITPVLLRTFVTHLDAWTVNCIRYNVSALFWLPLVLKMRGSYEPVVGVSKGRTIWKDALVPSAVNTLGQIGWGLSPYFLTAPVIAFAYRLSFLFTLALGFAFIAQERPLALKPAFWMGAVASVAGLALLFSTSLGAGNHTSGQGIAIVLITNLMFASYSVCVRRYLTGYPVRLSFGVISIYTGAALIPLMFAFGRYQDVAHISPQVWFTLIVSALIGIAISHVLYYYSIHTLGAMVSAGLLMSSPFVTAILTALFLNEQMTIVQSVGGITMIIGGAWLIRARGQVQQALVDRQTG